MKKLLCILVLSVGCSSTGGKAKSDAGQTDDGIDTESGQDTETTESDTDSLTGTEDDALSCTDLDGELLIPAHDVAGNAVISALAVEIGPITGTLKIPADTLNFNGFDDWKYRQGPTMAPDILGSFASLSNSSIVDGNWIASFEIEEYLASEVDPEAFREVLFVSSPDGEIVLSSVLTGGGELHFSIESTARQALSLASCDDWDQTERYFFGAAPDDNEEIEESLPSVVEALTAQLTETGSSAIDINGFAMPGTQVFDAVMDETSDPDVPVPLLCPVMTSRHMGQIANINTDVGVERLFYKAGSAWPQHIRIETGTDKIGYFPPGLVSSATSMQLYLRARTTDCRYSRPSQVITVDAWEGDFDLLPAEPQLEYDGEFKICGVEPGNSLLLCEYQTDCFAALPPEDGCVPYSSIEFPDAPTMIFARQVTGELLLGKWGGVFYEY